MSDRRDWRRIDPIKFILCLLSKSGHKWRHIQWSTGFTWMDDSYEAKQCICCRRVKDVRQTY
ncbi:hypothetical protein D3C74_54050 [compost metagenome]